MSERKMLRHRYLHSMSSTSRTLVEMWFSALTLVSAAVVVVTAQSKTVYSAVGGDVTLTCGTDSDDVTVEWFDYVHNNESDAINIRSRIKTSSEYRSKFQISPQHALSISRIQETDSGSYFCVIRPEAASRRNGTASHNYTVTVYSSLQCFGVTSLAEAETTELKCNSTVVGQLSASKMQWLRRDVTSDVDHVVDSRDGFDVRLAQRTVNVPPVTHSDDRTVYTCRMDLDDVSECQLVLNVSYPVRELKLDPVKDVYKIGDEIRCSAAGNPPPSIVVRPMSGSAKTGPGSTSVFVPEQWLNGSEPIELVCTASNTVKGVENVLTTKITFRVDNTSLKIEGKPSKTVISSAASSSTPIIIGIVIGVLILVAILFAVVCMRLCKDRKAAKASKTPPPPPPPAGVSSTSHRGEQLRKEKRENNH